ncbi:MAG: sulfotransferase [Bacteroidetes bacterium HGW-Bacteroidetes-21]|jgi:hypothetical protein|nr:MAG: sulfotransferase [Bacteroidetes bacterium HGW-Bacteroidetes-21]
MKTDKNIIWLASYPKSGNTWFRTILAYLYKKDSFDINQLDISPIYSSRTFIENETGVDSTDLTPEESDELRISIFDKVYGEYPSFFKIHDAMINLPDGRPLIPVHQTHCALYFVRNPLDVAVSFANHSSKTIEKTIENMGRDQFSLAASTKKYNNQFRQKLLSWSGHVESWTRQTLFPVRVLRYEDMLAQPEKIFLDTIINYLKLPFSETEVIEAVNACSFENLKKLEMEKGFKEKPPGCSAFFRKGVSGDFVNHLSDSQIMDVKQAHAKIMKEYNYL